MLSTIKPIKDEDDIFACDEGEDISRFREQSEEKIKAIFEKTENNKG